MTGILRHPPLLDAAHQIGQEGLLAHTALARGTTIVEVPPVSTLLNTLFAQSAPLILLALALFGLASFAISMLLMVAFRSFNTRLDQAVPVTTFMSTITTAWALALGFAAADVWSARAQADQAASEERSTIARLVGIAGPDALDVPMMIDGLIAYKTHVRDIEWGADANRDPAPEVDQALQQIRLGMIRFAQQGAPAPLVAKMAQDFDELQDARNKRLALGGSSISQYKWYLVLFLTVLSMISIATVHAERPPAARNALAVFAVAAVVSLWILALHALPYAGAARIGFEEIQFPITRS